MANWQDEAARFAPGLRVLLLQGKERLDLFDQIDEADLVLTTYALLPRDEEKLREHELSPGDPGRSAVHQEHPLQGGADAPAC